MAIDQYGAQYGLLSLHMMRRYSVVPGFHEPISPLTHR